MKKVIFIFIFFNFIQIEANIISTFTIDDNGWGSSKWSITNTSDGITPTDSYLLVDATSSRPKRGLILYNLDNSWTGDFISRGITGIQMDIRNKNEYGDSLRMRVAAGDVLNPMGGTWFVSKSFVEVTPSNLWQTIFIPISENDLEKAASAMESGSPGPLTYNQVMSDIYAFRILSQGANKNASAEDFYGDVLIDNIQIIPEPNTMSILLGSLIVLILYRNSKIIRKPALLKNENLINQLKPKFYSKITSRNNFLLIDQEDRFE